jgi:uncharacterized repeat protein (TIGR04052 family)
MHTVRTGALALGFTALLAAPAAAHDEKVNIRFAAMAGDEPVACGQAIEGLGSGNTAAQLADFRFFVSEVKLIRRGGKLVPLKLAKDSSYRVTEDGEGVTLIDLENGRGSCGEEGTRGMNDVVRGTVPHGTYTGVRYTIGVPFELNHTDAPASPAPLNSAAMAWSWQSGRKYTKIEVTDPGGATGSWKAKTFFIHLGAGGCTGNPATGQTVSCSNPNRPAVRLKRFNFEKQKIAVDLKALLAGNDITVNQADAPGCMSSPDDPECGNVFGSLALNWKADGSGNGAPSGGKQTVFRAIAR